MLKRVREGLAWRYRRAVREAARRKYLRRTFRNGDALVNSYTRRVPCDEAVCRDGLIVRHPPGRTALAQMLLEVWCDEVYTRDFYAPSSGDVIIDAGANVGLFSLWLARNCPGCRVLAFEPFPENYQCLSANLAAAHAENVTAVFGAVAADAGEAAMIEVGERSQDHRLSVAPTAGGHKIHTHGMASILLLAGTDRIALFKCDIEGSEHDLFEKAATDDLRKVLRFAVEYHDNIRPGTLQLIQARLRNSHSMVVRADGRDGYGMLYATRNDVQR